MRTQDTKYFTSQAEAVKSLQVYLRVINTLLRVQYFAFYRKYEFSIKKFLQ